MYAFQGNEAFTVQTVVRFTIAEWWRDVKIFCLICRYVREVWTVQVDICRTHNCSRTVNESIFTKKHFAWRPLKVT